MIGEEFIGKKVLVRSPKAGVYFGTLENVEADICKLSNARNLWHWTGANCLADIADKGVTGDKISCVITESVIKDVCQIMSLSEEAIVNIENQPVWTI